MANSSLLAVRTARQQSLCMVKIKKKSRSIRRYCSRTPWTNFLCRCVLDLYS